MASGSWTFSTANKYITGQVTWSSTSNGSSANSSTVTVTLKYKKSSSSTASTYGSGSFYITIAGHKKTFSDSYTFSANNSYKTIGSYSYKVSHSSDGSGSCKISAGGGLSGTSFSSSSTSKTVTLDKIPRYATIKSFSCSTKNQTSLTFKWSADVKCSEIWGNIGSTNKYHGKPSATSGSFTISKLAPNTSYSITLKVERADSGLTTSKTIKVTTLPVAKISGSANFNIGSDLTLKFSNYNNNASYLKLSVLNDSGKWENDIATANSAKGSSSYTWKLSEIASTLYSKCTTKNSTSIKITCGVTLNGTDYESITQGTMTVVNSNPTFSTFSFKNTDSKVTTVLGSDQYMIAGYGNLQLNILAANKAVALNSATIKEYVATITQGSYSSTKKANYSSTSNINIDFGTLKDSGNCKIDIYAIDSRSNKSPTVSKTFTVLPYSPPSVNPTITRLNSFEKEILLSLTGYCSKITLNNVIKNNSVSIKYKKSPHGTTTYSDYVELTYTKTDQSGTDNYVLSKSITSSPYFDVLPTNESWDYEFIIEDKIMKSDPIIITVDQGIAVATIVDDGKFLVGMSYNDAEETKSDSLMQVNSDITGKDKNGNYLDIIKTLQNMIIDSSTEPTNQQVGGYWNKITNL